jgi:hypothetical protein
MPFKLNQEKNENEFNNIRANRWTDATLALSGTALSGESFGNVHITGGCPQVAGPLQYEMLYELISKNACNVVSTTDYEFSSTFSSTFASYQYVPADLPKFHIPKSGSSEYVIIFNTDGTDADASLCITERSEGK